MEPYWIETEAPEGRTPRRNKKHKGKKPSNASMVNKDILCKQVKRLKYELGIR